MKYARVINGVVISVNGNGQDTDCTIPCPEQTMPGDLFDGNAWDHWPSTKIALLEAIDRKTSELIEAGYTYNGKIFSASKNAQDNAQSIPYKVQQGTDFTGLPLSTIDNLDSHIVVNNDDMLLFAQGCIDHVANCRLSGAILKEQVRQGLTIEDNR